MKLSIILNTKKKKKEEEEEEINVQGIYITPALSYVIHCLYSCAGTCSCIVFSLFASGTSHSYPTLPHHVLIPGLIWSFGPINLSLSGCILTTGGSTSSQFVFVHCSSPGMGYTTGSYAFLSISIVYQSEP